LFSSKSVLAAEKAGVGLPQMRAGEPDRIVTLANWQMLMVPYCKSVNSLQAAHQKFPADVLISILVSRNAKLFGLSFIIMRALCPAQP
jgi:hypothetical protein